MTGRILTVEAADVILSRGVRDPETECWEWAGTRFRGYGMIGVRGLENRRAHRVSYETFVGPIPDGLTIDHLCRNRGCVNPAHLEPVTNKVNVLRGVGPTAVNARKTHCCRGHEFTPENTLLSSGRRYCRACIKVRKEAA